MGYIAFASAKASPGVTTTLAALAANWPDDRRLVIAELDPAGGDLAVRYDLAADPGLVSLAAAGRRDLSAEALLEHTQPLPGPSRHDRRVLVAPVAADQSVAALTTLRDRLASVLAAADADVLVDCGRLDPASPTSAIVEGAALFIPVVRPVVAEVHHLTTRLASLRPAPTSLLVIGDAPYRPEEVANAVGVTAVNGVPEDRRAAQALTVGHPDALRVIRRSPLLRSARSLAEALSSWLAEAASLASRENSS